MCLPVAALALGATALSAVGTGTGALQANATAQYQAKVAEQNAAMSREAAQQSIQNTQQDALAQYRKIAQVKGQQIVGAAANGVGVFDGTAAGAVADTTLLGNEDVSRIYQQGNQNLRGYDIQGANYTAQASADRQAGAGALVNGLFSVGSTVLGGVSQYKKLSAGL
jgi:hypothetical protein